MWIYSMTNNMEFQQFLLPGPVRARFNPGEVWTEIFPPIQGQDEKLGSFGNSQSWNSTQFHQFHPSFSSYSHPSSWNLDTRIPENIWSFPKKKKGNSQEAKTKSSGIPEKQENGKSNKEEKKAFFKCSSTFRGNFPHVFPLFPSGMKTSRGGKPGMSRNQEE